MSDLNNSASLLNIFGLFQALWRNKIIFLACVAVFTIIALYMAISATPMFTARSTLLPHRNGSEGSMSSSLALFYGTSLGGTNYEDLIEEIVISDTILDSLIQNDWDYLGEENVSLFDVFQIVIEDSLKADYQLRTILRLKSIMVHRDLMTGFITISVMVPKDPNLAANLANTIVGKVMEFNFHFHDSHAKDNRDYLNSRLQEIQVELNVNESRLAEFTRNNRSYASSPDLLQQYGEMRRKAEASNAAWLEVRRQLEVALLGAHKGPPVVEVLDPARPPVYRTSPKREIMVIFGFIFGAIVGFVVVVSKEFLPRVILPQTPK